MTDDNNELPISSYPLDHDGSWVLKEEAKEIYQKDSDNAFDTYVSRMKKKGTPITNHHKKQTGLAGNKAWTLKYFVPNDLRRDYDILQDKKAKQQEEPITMRNFASVIKDVVGKTQEAITPEQTNSSEGDKWVEKLILDKDKELNSLRDIKVYEQRLEDKDKQIDHLKDLFTKQQAQLVAVLNQESDKKLELIKQHNEAMIKLYKELNKENRELQVQLSKANEKSSKAEVYEGKYNDLAEKLSLLLSKLNI